jgi:hypothetical protein
MRLLKGVNKMGFFSDLFSSPDPEARMLSSLSPEQQTIQTQLSDWLSGRLDVGATRLTGPLVAGIPSMFTQAYQNLGSSMGQYDDVLRNAMLQDVNAVPAYEYDPSSVAQQWQQGVAIPALETYRQIALPMLERGFNAIPGALYSAARGRGVEDATNRFYGQQVLPTLYGAQQAGIGRGFQSGENAAARRLSGVTALTGFPGAQFDIAANAADRMRAAQQVGISANLNEQMRLMGENNPYVSQMLQFMGIPTMTGYTFREQLSPMQQFYMGNLSGIGSSMMGMASDMMAGMGGAGSAGSAGGGTLSGSGQLGGGGYGGYFT